MPARLVHSWTDLTVPGRTSRRLGYLLSVLLALSGWWTPSTAQIDEPEVTFVMSRRTITYGHGVFVHGQVRSSESIPGEECDIGTVTILSDTWDDIAENFDPIVSFQTEDDGRYFGGVVPNRSATYRARFEPHSSACRGGTSRT